MQKQSLALAAASLVLLAGCAMQPPSQASSTSTSASMATSAPPNCELASVPPDAVFGVREGMDTASWPSQVPRGHTGCQRVWFGERAHPEAMQVLATYYFDQGHVQRLVGQVPGGTVYDCRYRDGTLDNGGSRNPGLCPDASQVDQGPGRLP